MGQGFQAGQWQILEHLSQKGPETFLSGSSLRTWGSRGTESGRDLPTVTLGAGSSGRPRAQVPLLLTNAQGGRRGGSDQRHQVGACEAGWLITEDFCPQSPNPRSCLILPAGALEIRQALPIHAGRYTCTAQNAAGVAHKHMVLTVQGRVLRAVSSDSHGPGGRGAGTDRARGVWGWGGMGGRRVPMSRPASDLTPSWASGRKSAHLCLCAKVSRTSCSF